MDYTQFRIVISAHDDAGSPGGPKVIVEVDGSNGTFIVTEVTHVLGAGSQHLSAMDAWQGLDLHHILQGLPKVPTALTAQPEAHIPQPETAAREPNKRECPRCHRLIRLRPSGNLAQHKDNARNGEQCVAKTAARANYRTMPDSFRDFYTQNEGVPQVTMAKEYEVPPYTIKKWIMRIQRENEIQTLPIEGELSFVEPVLTP
jgi:hypothetical protein